MSILVLCHVGKCHAANDLVMYVGETSILEFKMNNLPFCALSISYKDKSLEEMRSILLLESVIGDHLSKQ